MSNAKLWHKRFIRETGLTAAIAELVEPTLEGMGFRLIRVKLIRSDHKQTLQVMADRKVGLISIDDCEIISQQLSPLLDAFDAMPDSYRLEISSPGIDRPLVSASDFEEWSGFDAKIELYKLLDGQRRFQGVLEGFDSNEVRIEVELDCIGRRILGLPIELIESARLVLTDELVKESLRRSKACVKNADAENATQTAVSSAKTELSPEVKGK